MKRFKLLDWVTRSKARMVWIIAALLLLVYGGVRVIGGRESQPQYQTARVEQGTIVSSISASGSILTANVSNITTSATGVVTNVYVNDGEMVTAGQKIAEVTSDTSGSQKNAAAWSAYLSAKNAVDSANVTVLTLQSDMFSKWDEFKTLAENSTYQNSDGTPRYEQRALPEFHIAEKDWLAAEAKFKNQQAVITQSQAALGSAWLSYQAGSPIISAPMAGTISNITIVPGMTLSTTSTDSTVTPGQRVAVIRSEGKPLVSVNLSEIDVPQVRPGQKVTVTVDALADKTFTGTVVSVDRIGTVSSGVVSYPAIITLDTQTEDLLPNMAATASIILTSKSDVLLVPLAAIQTQDEQAYALVWRDGKELQIPVETGIFSDSQTEVKSGLSEGDKVITGTVAATTTQGTRSVFGGFGSGGFGVRR